MYHPIFKRLFDIFFSLIALPFILFILAIVDPIIFFIDKGYRSKFILHPNQLNYLSSIPYYNEEEIRSAQKVVSQLDIENDFEATKIDGQIIEKYHIKRIKKILKFYSYDKR